MIQQKKLRKNVVLTDTQSRRLHELSELDGIGLVEHTMRAIEEYLRKKNLDYIPPKEDDIIVTFQECSADPDIRGAYWLSGLVDRYEFSALLLKLHSKSAIEKGKISKLSIWDPVIMKDTKSFIGSCIVNYDRGWDIKPSKIAQPYYIKLKSLIDQSADQFIKNQHLR